MNTYIRTPSRLSWGWNPRHRPHLYPYRTINGIRYLLWTSVTVYTFFSQEEATMTTGNGNDDIDRGEGGGGGRAVQCPFLRCTNWTDSKKRQLTSVREIICVRWPRVIILIAATITITITITISITITITIWNVITRLLLLDNNLDAINRQGEKLLSWLFKPQFFSLPSSSSSSVSSVSSSAVVVKENVDVNE